MTSKIENLKRKGGDQLSDWTAPRTTASKPIIAHHFSSFDVLNECSNEFNAACASVGIDGNALLSKIHSFNGQKINKHIALTKNDPVFAFVREYVFFWNKEPVGYYPVITLNTSKHGGHSVTFSGLEAATARYRRVLGLDDAKVLNRKNTAPKRDFEAEAKARQAKADQAEAKKAAYKAKRLNDFHELFKTLPREVGNHAYLIKKFGHLAPLAALSVDLRRGNDGLGDFIAYALHGQSGRVVGYQKIYAQNIQGRDDNKDFIGSMGGAFAIVGDAEAVTGRAYIAEGLANAITYHLATGEPCFVALNAGNLKNVVPFVRGTYAENITILADNDRKNLAQNGNTGINAALKAITYGGKQYDYLIIAPCDDAVNWDLNDVLVSDGYNIEAVKAVVSNKENRRKVNIDKLGQRLESIELLPYNQREKAVYALLAYAVDCAPTRPLDKSLERIKRVLGHEWSAFLESKALWISQKYNAKIEAVKPLFSFKDNIAIHFAPKTMAKHTAKTLLENSGLYIDNRGTGSGKTLNMAEVVKLAKLYESQGLRVGYVSHRVSLSANSSARLRLENYQDLKPHDMPDVQYMAIVANSLAKWHFAAFYEDCDVLFIDEIKQVLEHIAVGTFDNRDRAKVLATIKKAIQNAKLIICADADLDQTTLDFLKSCGKPIRRIASDISGNAPKIDKPVIHSDTKTIRDEAIRSAIAGNKLLIHCDTKGETESLKLVLISSGLSESDILVVNSDTKAEPSEALFLKDPDAYLAEYQPRIVLASPTIGSGFSIEQKYFDDVYMLLTGILTPTDIMQMSARYRPAKRLFIGFEDKNNRPEATSDATKLLGDMLINRRLKLAIDPMTDKLTIDFRASELDTLRYKILMQQEESRKDYANKTLLCFVAKGHTVEKFDSVEVANLPSYQKASKQAKKAVKERRIDAIIHADAIDAQQAEQHEKKANTTTLKEKLELARFKITEQLAISEPTWESIKFWEDKGLKKIHLFETLQADEKTCIDFDKQQAMTQENLSLRTKALEKHRIYTMIFDGLGIDKQTGKGSFSFTQALDTLKRLQVHHNELAALGFGNFEKINERYAIRSITNLIKRLGLDTEAKQTRQGRIYSIKENSWQCMVIHSENRKKQKIHALNLNQAANVFTFAEMTDDEILKNWGQKTA
jgi:putative DNA primase/helicase